MPEIEQREQMKAEGEEVKQLGGLHVIGSERHEARRIDLQLRGRCGRQGDPGISRFFLSLEDDLMRIFAGEWVKNVLTRLGMQEGEAIESKMVSRRIEGAQKKVEERNFESRKNLLEYDEVMDEQRKRVYGFRQEILDGVNCKIKILEMIEEQIDRHLDDFLDKDYGAATFAKWAGSELGVELEPRDYRGLDFDAADRLAKDEAQRQAEGQVLDAIEENLPEDADADEWNWEALAKFANTRWKLNFRDRELKQAGRDHVGELLIEKAREALEKIDLAEGARFLDLEYGLRTAVAWVHYKFGIELPWDEVQEPGGRAAQGADPAKGRSRPTTRKRSSIPVLAGLYHFTTQDAGGQKRYDREKLVDWARQRFAVELDLDDLRNKQRDEVRDLLIEHSRRASAAGRRRRWPRCSSRSPGCFRPDAGRRSSTAGRVDGSRQRLRWPPLSAWLHEQLDLRPAGRRAGRLDRAAAGTAAVVGGRRPLPARNPPHGAVAGAATARHRLERPSAGDGPPALQRRPARLCPGRSQGRVQARRHADFRADVDRRRRTRHRPDLPHGAARRELRRLDLGRKPGRARLAHHRPWARPTTSSKPSTTPTSRSRSSRSATARSKSAATIPAPAAAARSTRTAACARDFAPAREIIYRRGRRDCAEDDGGKGPQSTKSTNTRKGLQSLLCDLRAFVVSISPLPFLCASLCPLR